MHTHACTPTSASPGCDVGKAIPIGAYLFNPMAANHSVNGQTFTEWFVDEYLFGPNGEQYLSCLRALHFALAFVSAEAEVLSVLSARRLGF
jgi:hypothetical protein